MNESSTAVNVNTCDPPPPTTVACADTTAPFTVPSFGVTSTDTVSPASPFPATDRSSVSVNDAVEAVVFTATPFTFHTYVNDTVSPASGSDRVAVAVNTSPVSGVVSDSETVAEGGLFPGPPLPVVTMSCGLLLALDSLLAYQTASETSPLTT